MRHVLDKLFGNRTEDERKGQSARYTTVAGQRAATDRNSPRDSPSPSPGRTKPQRFSVKHQVYANRREEDTPLIERQRSYINYARNKLLLDRIDHKKLSNSAIMNMSFPIRSKHVSESSTNVTDRTLHVLKNSSFHLSPNASGTRHANKLKIREHNLKFVSSKDLQQPALTTSNSEAA